MYVVPLQQAPPLGATDEARCLAAAKDAGNDAAARVSACHQLRGCLPERRDAVARALVAVLNEPLHWLAGEALLCIAALAPDLPVGLDADERLVASATPTDNLVDDGEWLHCPILGPTATAFELPRLPGLPALPWTVVAPVGVAFDVDGRRFYRTGARVTFSPAGDVALTPAAAGGPSLELAVRSGDGILRLADDNAGAGVRMLGEALRVGGVTARRVVAGSVVEVGAQRLTLRRFDRERQPDRGRVWIHLHGSNANTDLRVGMVRVIAGRGHVVALNDEDYGVVVGTAALRRDAGERSDRLGDVVVEGVATQMRWAARGLRISVR